MKCSLQGHVTSNFLKNLPQADCNQTDLTAALVFSKCTQVLLRSVYLIHENYYLPVSKWLISLLSLFHKVSFSPTLTHLTEYIPEKDTFKFIISRTIKPFTTGELLKFKSHIGS